MLQVTIIGHLGADAEVKEANGKQFVSFRVAHSEKWSGQDGVSHESTTWVSCLLNGDGGGLLPYLKRGQCVFAQGRASLRVYSSKVQRAMVAGINLNVDRIELVGGAADAVPREVIEPGGGVLRTYKAFYVNTDSCNGILPAAGNHLIVKDARGGEYNLDSNGFVWPVNNQSVSDDAQV